MAKVFLTSLGCDKNRVDGEVMEGALRLAGYEIVNEPDIARAIIINTCGFIREAVQESIDMALELAAYKESGRCRALVIAGCMAERYKTEMGSIPEADAIIGVGEYNKIADVLKTLGVSPPAALLDACCPNPHELFEKSSILTSPSPKLGVKGARPLAGSGAAPHGLTPNDPYLSRLAARKDDPIPHIAYVKIAEGCDNNCAYCTIPMIRGGYRSRPMENILEECRLLVKAGARELVLVAQDTALYGTDIYGAKKLPELLEQIAKTSGAAWIRLMYVYPEHITPALITAMAELPQVCKYIDMPIQHSEESVLLRMGRGGSRYELTNLIRVLRDRIPGIAIRTTLMVGFPGETAEDFRNLYDFAQNIKFDRMGAFPYSREEGTPAASFPRQVKEETKRTRLDRLMTLQRKIHFEKQKSYIGQTLPVIIDSTVHNDCTGRTQYDAYEVDAVVNFSSPRVLKPGEICPVRITAAEDYDLRGEYEPS